MAPLACIGNKQLIGAADVRFRQERLERAGIEIEFVDWLFLLFEGALVIENIDPHVSLHAGRSRNPIGEEQNLSRKSTAGEAVQSGPFRRLPEAEHFHHGMLRRCRRNLLQRIAMKQRDVLATGTHQDQESRNARVDQT